MTARRASAEPPTAELALEANAAHENCVADRALRARVEATEGWILRAPPAPAAKVSLRASVQGDAADGLAVELRVAWPDGRSAQRSLAAHSCEAALDALVLLVHMTLDATSADATPPASTQPASARALEAPRAAADAPERVAGFFRVDQLALGGSVGVAGGAQPGAAPVLGLLAALSLRGSGYWRPRLQLELSHAWRKQVAAAGGRADFALDAGQLWVCPVGARAAEVFAAYGCGAFELGRLRARGYDTYAPRSVRRPWASLGVGALLSVRWLSRLELQLAAALLAPLWRDELSFAPEVFYAVPAWRWQLKVGVVLSFL